MYTLAILIGIYSYGIFLLGFFGVLTKINCFLITFVWFILLLFFGKSFFVSLFKKSRTIKFSFKIYKNPTALLFALFILLAFINLIGALGPELSFDALWYHLTLPKLYLLHHAIYHIPGGLLYYSDMPKLGEMLYTGALALGSEITAKLIHYFFGILCCVALYKFSRKFFTRFVSLLTIIIFYSNLVVDTESIAAYIDLIRTFFEILALWSFTEWLQKQKFRWFLTSALMVGLAITTKVLAIGSLVVFSILITAVSISKNRFKNIFSGFEKSHRLFIRLFVYWLIALLIPLPWFIFSFIHTGNPVYPFFTHTYEISPTSFGFFQFFTMLWDLFMYSPDPISPVYLIFLPLLFVTFTSFKKEMKVIVYYCGLCLILWYLTPQTGGGRFILPYLPALSLVCGAVYSQILKKTRIEWRYLSKILFFVIVFVATISIGYRFIANSKYIPVLIGKESQSQFLSSHLNFSFGDFYDTDGYFANHVKPSDTVLLYGFHNLYYVDFPFIDSSWIKKRDRFNYIAVQNVKLPVRFKNWQLVYSNNKTEVKLYKNSTGLFEKY